MIKTAHLARLALFSIVLLLCQSIPVQGHDDGLTCHEHPTPNPVWGADLLISSFQSGGVSVRVSGLINVEVDEWGDGRVAALGTASVRGDFAHDWAVLTLDGDATMACSDAGMMGFNLNGSFIDRSLAGGRATLSIMPVQPIREPGRHAVHFSLDYGAGVAEWGDAILVVEHSRGDSGRL